MTGLVLDVIVVVLAVLLVLFGIWRGMYKLLFGLISSILALVLTIVLAGSVTTLVINKTPLDDRISNAIDAPLSKYIPNANAEISFYDLNNDGNSAELGYEEDGEVKAFETLFENSKIKFLSKTLSGVVEDRLNIKDADGNFVNTSVVLIQAVSATVVGYIMIAIVAVVLFILLAIVVRLLLALLRKAVTKTYIGYFLDKLVGGVIGLAIAVLIIFGSLTIIKLLGTYEWIIPVNALIEESKLTKLLFNNNFIYAFLSESINLNAIINSILSKISGLKK